MTYEEALRERVVASIPRREIVLLLSHVTGDSQTEISLNPGRALSPSQEKLYLSLIRDRAAKIPLQYLLSSWQFMGFDFVVNPHVLIPRQDTEILVETAVKMRPSRVLDLCTGSGCIGISIAKLTGAEVTATDISREALNVAKQNARYNDVTGRVSFIESDLFESIPPGKYDLIISNPPYIPTSEMDGLQEEVRHEPRIALDGGADGLDFYREIIPRAKDYLAPQGTLLMEVGPAEGVKKLLAAHGYRDIETLRDLSGLERGVVCNL